MTKKSFNLRKVVAIAICLAGVTMFSGCNKDDENAELQGLWKVDDEWCVEIKGNQAYIVLLDAEALRLGLSNFLKVGDIAIKNLKKQKADTWIGNEVYCFYSNATGRVTNIAYDEEDTFVLSKDKNTLDRISGSDGEILTYHRVQRAIDPVPYARSNAIPQQTQYNGNIEIIKLKKH